MDFLKFYLKNIIKWLVRIVVTTTSITFFVLGFKYYFWLTTGFSVKIVFLSLIFMSSVFEYEQHK